MGCRKLKKIILALRGTMTIADLVTDAVCHPEPLDSWLPDVSAACLPSVLLAGCLFCMAVCSLHRCGRCSQKDYTAFCGELAGITFCSACTAR